MRKRLDSLTRIGRFQNQMHDLGRSRLHSIERQHASLSDDLKAIFETLEAGDLAYGTPAKLSQRHLRTLQGKLESLAREQKSARARMQGQGMRAKLLEHAIEAAALSCRTQNERKELAELIERAIARRGTSPT